MGALSIPGASAWGAPLSSQLGRETDAVWLLDVDHLQVVWANLAGLEVWGAETLSSLQARDLTTLLDAGTLGHLGGNREQVRRGHVVRDRWTLLGAAGQTAEVEVLLAPAELSDGRVGMLCRARGTQAQPELPRGVEALSHTRLMVSMFTPQGSLLFENPAAARAHAPASALAAATDSFSSRFVDPSQAAAIRRRLEAGQAVEEDVEVPTASGVRWHNLSARVITDPLTGAPCWLVEEQDIGRRKRNELALAEVQSDLAQRVRERTAELERQRDFFQSVFDTVSALTLVASATGRVVQANAWARSFFPGGHVLGRDVRELCGFPAEGELEAWFAAGDAPAQAVEVVIELPGKERRNVLWTPRLTAAASGPQQLVLSGVDVTPLRETETQLQVADRMATIGTLAAGIAHDLNNPLAVVITNQELLLEESTRLGLGLEVVGMIQDGLDGARRASAIVSQLRTFARGSASGAAGVAHVASVVEFAARMAHNQVRHRAQIEVECASDLFVAMDESRLGQVVLNLLVLAVDAIEAGDASRHRVAVTGARASQEWVMLAVEDDGPGLEPEDVRRVFDPYSGTRTPPQGFAGLGLAVSHRIVTDAGGRIAVDSEVGRGTKVQVWLRALDAPGVVTPAHAQPPGAAATAPAAPREARILIVDDEERLRSVVRRTLRGYQVDGAANGREALERLRERSYDLILCDVMMPEMTGVELFRVLQEAHPELVERVVFLSGGAFTPETIRFLDTVGRPVIDKPFRMEELRGWVERILRRDP